MANLKFIEEKHKQENERRGVVVARRIAIYTRQSVDKRDSLSIEGQIEECRKFVNNGELFDVYSDKGFSGKNTQRPEFLRLIDDVQNGKIKQVIVYKIDRFSRSILDFYSVYEILKNHDCDFLSVKEKDIDTTTPSGRAMLGIIAIFAQLERETTQQRIFDNYYQRIRSGHWGGGFCYGFDNVKINGQSTLKINHEQMKQVELIFQLYKDGNTISEIVKYLNSNGFKTKKGGSYYSGTITHLLHNPIYTKGTEELYDFYSSQGYKIANPRDEWNGTRAGHIIKTNEAKKNTFKYSKDNVSNCIIVLVNTTGGTIDTNDFIEIQKRMSTNKQIERKHGRSFMGWTSGLVKCGKCGIAVSIYDRKYKKLYCRGKVERGSCDNNLKIWNLDLLKQKVGDEIQNRISDIELLKQKKKIEFEETKKEITKLEKEITRLVVLAASVGNIDEITNQITERQNKINELKLTGDFFTSQISKYEDILFQELDDDEKQQIARELIDKIFIYDDGTLSIDWKI